MQIRAVAFDIDGTLYPNATMYLKSLPFVLMHLRLMLAFAAVRNEVRHHRPVDDLKRRQAELLAGRLRIGVDEAAERIDREIYGKWERVLDRVRPYPHVRECVERLRGAAYHVGVTSDFPVERKLERLGLDGLFDCRLWTEQSGYLKPYPEPFRELASCLGLEPKEILYVGNSYEYDIVGAKNVGMHAAHLTKRPPADSVADLSFSDYRELCRFVLGESG